MFGLRRVWLGDCCCVLVICWSFMPIERSEVCLRCNLRALDRSSSSYYVRKYNWCFEQWLHSWGFYRVYFRILVRRERKRWGTRMSGCHQPLAIREKCKSKWKCAYRENYNNGESDLSVLVNAGVRDEELKLSPWRYSRSGWKCFR